MYDESKNITTSNQTQNQELQSSIKSVKDKRIKNKEQKIRIENITAVRKIQIRMKKIKQDCLSKNSPLAKCIKNYYVSSNTNGSQIHERQKSIQDHLLHSSQKVNKSPIMPTKQPVASKNNNQNEYSSTGNIYLNGNLHSAGSLKNYRNQINKLISYYQRLIQRTQSHRTSIKKQIEKQIQKHNNYYTRLIKILQKKRQQSYQILIQKLNHCQDLLTLKQTQFHLEINHLKQPQKTVNFQKQLEKVQRTKFIKLQLINVVFDSSAFTQFQKQIDKFCIKMSKKEEIKGKQVQKQGNLCGRVQKQNHDLGNISRDQRPSKAQFEKRRELKQDDEYYQTQKILKIQNNRYRKDKRSRDTGFDQSQQSKKEDINGCRQYNGLLCDQEVLWGRASGYGIKKNPYMSKDVISESPQLVEESFTES